MLCVLTRDEHRHLTLVELAIFDYLWKYGFLTPHIPAAVFILSRLAWNRIFRYTVTQCVVSVRKLAIKFTITKAISLGIIPRKRDIPKKNGYQLGRQFLLTYYMLPKKNYMLKFMVSSMLITVPIFLVLRIIEAHVLFTFLFLIIFFGTIFISSSYLITTSGKISLLSQLNFRPVRLIDKSWGYTTVWRLFILSLDIVTGLTLACIFLGPLALTVYTF